MALHFNDTIRNSLLNNLRSYADGYCKVYPGTRPPNPDYPSTESPLVSFNLQFNSASFGLLSLSNAPIASEVQATGTATWFRLEDGNYKIDGDISIEGGGGDAILDNVALTAGEMVTLKQLDFSIPNPS
uniref:Uncharacterized protein n=1 Tax=Magnetococcus massalia (strain MO-1) TaxID=451514 RepID=A0A1S7LJV4_MAGMO|nr:conserved protein of unknown function [Candidatus Magnetococcus massalia]